MVQNNRFLDVSVYAERPGRRLTPAAIKRLP